MNTNQNYNDVSALSTRNAESVAYSPIESNWQLLEYLWLDIAEASRNARSAWDKGIVDYMSILYFKYHMHIGRQDDILTAKQLREILLNNAVDWQQSSESGCYLVNSCDIAKALLPPSQQKRLTNNYKALELQACALSQAANYIVAKWSNYINK